jgi:2-C-methyl-D-erythritol 2,4-cyclodiphosphate synthase
MIRVGFGYDVHRFREGRRLVLGGVEIPHDCGLDGHSDADVVLHAIADAMLGAAAMGDIGEHFPPGDPRWRDADSADLLTHVRHMTGQKWTLANVDVMIVAEAPRVGPYRTKMRTRIAELLDIAIDAVNVKATTNERMGFIGRGEGIAAMATALLVRSTTDSDEAVER